MSKIPVLKKKISAFLSKEDGKISKENLIKAGIFLTLIAASVKEAEAGYAHTNGLTATKAGTSLESSQATGTHSHHYQHSSY